MHVSSHFLLLECGVLYLSPLLAIGDNFSHAADVMDAKRTEKGGAANGTKQNTQAGPLPQEKRSKKQVYSRLPVNTLVKPEPKLLPSAREM